MSKSKSVAPVTSYILVHLLADANFSIAVTKPVLLGMTLEKVDLDRSKVLPSDMVSEVEVSVNCGMP